MDRFFDRCTRLIGTHRCVVYSGRHRALVCFALLVLSQGLSGVASAQRPDPQPLRESSQSGESVDNAFEVEERELETSDIGEGDPEEAMMAATEATDATVATSAANETFFEERIRPVLVKHCHACHAGDSKSLKGGLRVDTRGGLRDGGDSGPAIVPGHPEQSLLLQALRHDGLQMPPKERLPDRTIADFEMWIRDGAPDPRGEDAPTERASISSISTQSHWAFQTPDAHPLASISRKDWPWQRIDYFLLQKMEAHKLSPQVDASPATLLRRLALDLTGLPPDTEQVRRFQAAPTRDAYTRIVDQYLASPEFGRRWGRHWLDAARYADTMGQTRNVPLAHAWRYRNYVIEASNADLPHDQFIREQLAGDLLEGGTLEERTRRLVATGFLALGSHDLNERNPQAYMMQVVAEQIDTVTRSMMGITLACARCHDHKFDPLTMHDYYGLAGIFVSTELRNGFSNNLRGGPAQERRDLLVPLADRATSTKPASSSRRPASTDTANRAETRAQLQILRRQLAMLRGERRQVQEADQLPPERKQARLRRLDTQIQRRQQQIRKLLAESFGPAVDRRSPAELENAGSGDISREVCVGVLDAQNIRDCRINLAGEPLDLGERVPRRFPTILTVAGAASLNKKESGRRELAEWMTHPSNPLTARVFVNRVWSHLFGAGLVESLDNFGLTGTPPTHLELLDDLARRFIESGWSTKHLVRELVLSHAYAMSSASDSSQQSLDPANRWLWRMNRKRLEFEVIRDTMLASSRQLALDLPTTTLSDSEAPRPRRRSQPDLPDSRAFTYRSVFLPVMRNRIPASMTAFNFPASNETQGQREVTTSPTQALFFLNDPLVIQCSEAMTRSHALAEAAPAHGIEHAYLLLLGRLPDAEETARAARFLAGSNRDTSDPDKPAERRWARWLQTLMASAEFRFAL